MANYCPNCGQSVDSAASFCPSCGAALNGGSNTYNNTNAGYSNTAGNAFSAASGILGTLVAVSLVGGLTRQLYYYGGRYFLDPYCRRPFASPHLIMGPHRMIRPMGPVGGFRPPMGGGFHGPMGGPRGGGPRGGRR